MIICTIFLFGIWIFDNTTHIQGRLPVPTEFDINKSKHKDFKNQRKEYLKNMHRSHQEEDWEKWRERNERKKRKQASRNRINYGRTG